MSTTGEFIAFGVIALIVVVLALVGRRLQARPPATPVDSASDAADVATTTAPRARVSGGGSVQGAAGSGAGSVQGAAARRRSAAGR